MLSRWFVAGLMLLAGSSCMRAESVLEKQLTEQYRGQIFTLRHAFQSDFQNYDVNGTLQNYFPEGAWTTYGRVLVKEITVDSKELRLTGQRVFYGFEKKQGRLIPAFRGKQVRIRIELREPLNSLSDATSVLARVFASSQEEVLLSVPPYWRHYLTKETRSVAGRNPVGGESEVKTEKASPASTAAPERSSEADKVFRLGDPGVVAPKPQFTPEPNFTDAARGADFQGTLSLEIVVDKTGKVSDIQIVKPLGMGLDDNAVSTVRTWRFTPATVNGQPVSVAFSVEVDFHLYMR